MSAIRCLLEESFGCRDLIMAVFGRQTKSPVEDAPKYIRGQIRKTSNLVPDPDAQCCPSHDGLHRTLPMVLLSTEPCLCDRCGQHGIGTDTWPLRDLD